MSKMIKDSDALGQFWAILVMLADRGDITQGWHYRIKGGTSYNIRTADGTKEVKLDSPKRVLYLRLPSVQGEYSKAMNGVKSSPLGKDTILHYLKGTNYYLGENKAERFKKHEKGNKIEKTTSSIMLDYDVLEKMDIYLNSTSSYKKDEEELEEKDPLGNV